MCHGPAGILEATGEDGKSIINGRKCTGFSNTEEEGVGKMDRLPFLLEDRMKEIGGKYEKKGDWADFSLRDGLLVTGEWVLPCHRLSVLLCSCSSARCIHFDSMCCLPASIIARCTVKCNRHMQRLLEVCDVSRLCIHLHTCVCAHCRSKSCIIWKCC